MSIKEGQTFISEVNYANEEDKARIQFDSMIKNMYAALPVRVVGVEATGLAPVGFCTLKPLINQVTQVGTQMEYPKILKAPYFRYQGGTNAIIIDPKEGDMGIAVFSSRDMSGVKRTRGEATVGSTRRMQMSDAMYIGGIMNSTPQQYIMFDDTGIKIYSPTKIAVEAPEIVSECQSFTVNSQTTNINASTITLNAPQTNITGNINQTGASGSGSTMRGGITNIGGDIVSNDISLENHVHGGVTSGGSKTHKPE